MKKQKMLAALLAGLITLSLAGCAADKASDNTESGAVSTESSITATVTDNTSEPTAENSLPMGTESTTESTAEKEKESSTAPADSGKTEITRSADTESPKQTETPKVTETPKQTEPPKITEPPKQTEPPKVTEPPTKPTEPQPTEPPATEPPKGFTEAEHTRIVSEVRAYAESYTAKGFTFEWAEELAFGWDVGWMGTPRISRDGVDGVISTLKHHVDLIYKTGTDPANGVTANSVRYKVVQLEIDGGIAYAVIYG